MATERNTLGSPLVMIFAMVVTVATIAGIVILAALGKPVADLMTVFAAAAIPSITVYLAQISAKTDQVKEQVNGRLTQLIDYLARTNPPEDKL